MEKSLASDLARVLMDGKSPLVSAATKDKVVRKYETCLNLAMLGGSSLLHINYC